jgi:N-methylhydantoinase A/oxoprolinase/acetone carboxylase beta subunit
VGLGTELGIGNLITFDMGGTSTDVSLIRDGEPAKKDVREIAGFPVRTRSIDIHTIGAGGGSIAWVDAGGLLKVGPQSAGAYPGPAAYGRDGTRPTVTDANVVWPAQLKHCSAAAWRCSRPCKSDREEPPGSNDGVLGRGSSKSSTST